MKTIYQYLNEALQLKAKTWTSVPLKNIDDDVLEKIWDMYTTTYAKEGLDFSADDKNELREKYSATFLIDVDADKIPDAFIIYRETSYGNKIALLGTNDSKEAKKSLILELFSILKTRGWWIEASMKMEELLASTPSISVFTDYDAIQKMLKKPIEPLKDGYYYRSLSKVDKKITKRIYGLPKV